MTLAEQIKEARKKKALSTKELAREIMVPHRYIQKWEAGVIPSTTYWISLAKFLGLDINANITRSHNTRTVRGLNKIIKEARVRKGYSLSKLAAILNITEKTIRDWEHGSIPRMGNLLSLAKVLDINETELAEYMGVEEPNKDVEPCSLNSVTDIKLHYEKDIPYKIVDKEGREYPLKLIKGCCGWTACYSKELLDREIKIKIDGKTELKHEQMFKVLHNLMEAIEKDIERGVFEYKEGILILK